MAVFLLFLLVNLSFAQKMREKDIPAAVTSAFKTKFPDATKASWEKEGTSDYEVSFKLNGKEISANFDDAGKWLETETEIKISDLPVAVKKALKKDFTDFKIEETSKIENVKDGNYFEVEMENDEATFDVMFTVDGIVLRKTKLEEENEKRD